MHVVGLVKQKGGSGATTIAVHLAVAAADAGRRVVILDTDPQESAATWGAAREAEAPPVVAVDVRQLAKALQAAERDGYDLALVDTPPHSSAATAAVARAADLAVIPTRASAFDLAAIPSIVQIVEATRTPAVLVLNACGRTREVDEAREALAGLAPGVPVWSGQLGERTAYRRAVAGGRAVTEVGSDPDGKAAGEVRALWAHLAGLLR